MIKNVAIVSLSRGIIGESFVKFETDIGIKRTGLNKCTQVCFILGIIG
ncbi:hypothetical protein SAMN02910263_00564 [Butyrivibrio sp. INlla16]|nr:hypothetical protein SAMN02910263_00564 [Butyrivibrio sp. INlla16]